MMWLEIVTHTSIMQSAVDAIYGRNHSSRTFRRGDDCRCALGLLLRLSRLPGLYGPADVPWRRSRGAAFYLYNYLLDLSGDVATIAPAD